MDFEILFPDCIKQKDNHLYFIHKIYEEKLFESRYNKDSFINLHSHTLRSIIGERIFYDVRENLQSKGVIEINHSYSVDNFSKSYRLTDNYRNVKHIQVKLTNEKILQRIYKHKQKLINEVPEGIEYEMLYENLTKLNIDYLKANDFINRNYSNDPDKYNPYKISIDYIHEKNFYFKVDNVAGRVHTNITNLPKELRQFLSYNGQSLINIDISNSQPFLFNILIQNYFETKQPKTYFSFNSNSFSNFSNTSTSQLPTYKNISPYVVQFEDVKKYVELTSEGKFYEYVMKEGGVKKNKRAEFKKRLFGTVFFCNPSDRYNYKEAKLFNKLFPNVYEIIGNYKKEDYRQLAIKLQRAEAKIMINKVCRRIAEEKPEIFIATIHDSILTTEDNKNYVCDVILSEFEINFNLKPSIKID